MSRKDARYLVYYSREEQKWIVIKEGAMRASKKLDTRAEAEKHVVLLTTKYGGTYEVFRKNGTKNRG